MSLDRYTSIGSYPLFYVTRKYETLCPGCAEQADLDEHGPLVPEVNWEALIYCDQCSARLESAYSEDELNAPESDE